MFTLVIHLDQKSPSSVVSIWSCQVARWQQWLGQVVQANPLYLHCWCDSTTRPAAFWGSMVLMFAISVHTGCDLTWALSTRYWLQLFCLLIFFSELIIWLVLLVVFVYMPSGFISYFCLCWCALSKQISGHPQISISAVSLVPAHPNCFGRGRECVE